MRLEIIWSEFAEFQMDEIYNHYKKKASIAVANKLIKGILVEPDILLNNPYIGQKEHLLKERMISYRYLLHKSFKIIYAVDEENGLIKIADVFDTRQYPEKIKRTT